jgi:hypothetical protein
MSAYVLAEEEEKASQTSVLTQQIAHPFLNQSHRVNSVICLPRPTAISHPQPLLAAMQPLRDLDVPIHPTPILIQ